MRTSAIIIASVLSAIQLAAAFEVTAWSGAVCSGVELGTVEDTNNTPGLTAAEATPNGQCITIDAALPADCDVYLCADAACNDQGETVEGPRDQGTRVENKSFSAIQVGCQ
ncbi:hypothetical protein BD626DRAFT_534804 [Schizophyllum amplum]|uniref:Uncharacterized protein n=1 Tax=Schizophyllum amplum TaxID=97359 RepID=A0A550CPC3_9AGAR|nr:hypothetical protein BD626DRAFT_534804 [Auriculariopsis ampla]